MTLKVQRFYVPDSLQNYNHLVLANDQAACVDPFDWSLAQKTATSLGVTITEIWLTHGHGDHVAGVPADFAGIIRGHPDITRCQVTHPINVDSEFYFAGSPVQSLTTPGHTFDHLCFFLPDTPALIAGDTLFNCGVGNTRSGDTDVLYESILKLNTLPGKASVYNGHDYMPTNLAFTESVIGESDLSASWKQRCAATTPESRPVTTLDDERAINLFLRLSDSTLRKQLDIPAEASNIEAFRALRQRRDQW